MSDIPDLCGEAAMSGGFLDNADEATGDLGNSFPLDAPSGTRFLPALGFVPGGYGFMEEANDGTSDLGNSFPPGGGFLPAVGFVAGGGGFLDAADEATGDLGNSFPPGGGFLPGGGISTASTFSPSVGLPEKVDSKKGCNVDKVSSMPSLSALSGV